MFTLIFLAALASRRAVEQDIDSKSHLHALTDVAGMSLSLSDVVVVDARKPLLEGVDIFSFSSYVGKFKLQVEAVPTPAITGYTPLTFCPVALV